MNCIVASAAALALLTASAAFAAPGAPRPCLLVYKGVVERVGPGKHDILPTAKSELKHFFDDCVGLQLDEGSAEAIVHVVTPRKPGEPQKSGVEEERFAHIPIALHRPIEAAQLVDTGSSWRSLQGLLKGLDAVFGTDQVIAASRGADDGTQLLKDMLSETLVVPPNGLRMPLASGALLRVESVVFETTTLPQRPVAGVTLADHELAIAPGALAPGASYQWTAVVRQAEGTKTLTGVTDVAAADGELARRFAARAQHEPDASAAFADADYFLAHELKANATIVLTQWYARTQLPK